MKRRKDSPHIWVVEMLNDTYATVKPAWEPTVGVALDRDIARNRLMQWRERNPCDKFRLTKYSAEQKERT